MKRTLSFLHPPGSLAKAKFLRSIRNCHPLQGHQGLDLLNRSVTDAIDVGWAANHSSLSAMCT
jgi:hypothetical protein